VGAWTWASWVSLKATQWGIVTLGMAAAGGGAGDDHLGGDGGIGTVGDQTGGEVMTMATMTGVRAKGGRWGTG